MSASHAVEFETTSGTDLVVLGHRHPVSRASGAAEDAVSVLLCEIPAVNITEYGRVVPAPGEEDA
jgi:hypothetical protein